MADPLRWKEGEGYDIHLLRGGPESKKLVDALELDSSQADRASFTPILEGGVDNHGVELDSSSGTLRALMHPDPSMPRVNNFILLVLFDGPRGVQETEIRIHVHDSISEIWLTPSTLTIHEAADECRFTVLARFNDGVIGDITDWPQLSYQSEDGVKVLGGGILQAQAPGKQPEVTVTLNLASPATNRSATAKAITKASWAEIGAAAKVSFVAGKVVPNRSDPDSTAPDSIKSVVENATNILFVAEGFRQNQRGDFNNLVYVAVHELRTKSYLLPFKLLKDSLNYWSVFVPSENDGTSLLGDYTYEEVHFTGELAPLPRTPSDSAPAWSLAEMIHEVGLPIREEVEMPWLPDHVRRWQRLYGAKVTEDRTRGFYGAWTTLAVRAPLNERDSAFGMAVSDRPRASQGDRKSVSLQSDFRRTGKTSILNFIQNLAYAGHLIGSTWRSGGKDFGLVAFACLSDRNAGQQLGDQGYLTAGLGRDVRVSLRPVAGGGLDIQVAQPKKHSRTLFASVVAHECAHALGVWDEYGDGAGTSLADSSTVAPFPNVQAKSAITTTTTNSIDGTTTTAYDKTEEIKWLWPRLMKAGVVDEPPKRSSTGFAVPLRKGHGKPFRGGEVVTLSGSGSGR